MKDTNPNQPFDQRLETFANAVLANNNVTPDHLLEEQNYLNETLLQRGTVTLDQWMDAYQKRARPLHDRLEDFRERYIQAFVEATNKNNMSLLDQFDEERKTLDAELEKQGGIDLVTWWEDRNNLREPEFHPQADLRQPLTDENLEEQLEAYGRAVARNDNQEPEHLSEKGRELSQALLKRGNFLGVWLNQYLGKQGPFDRLLQLEKKTGAFS